jgi:hypothetical protein
MAVGHLRRSGVTQTTSSPCPPIPDAVDQLHRVGAGAEHHRSGSCGLSDGVAVDPGIVLDDGVAAGECNGYTRDVAREGSTGHIGGVAQNGAMGPKPALLQ